MNGPKSAYSSALHQDSNVLNAGEVAVVGYQRKGVDLQRSGQLDCVGQAKPVALPQTGSIDCD
jgi:hypothetical protein